MNFQRIFTIAIRVIRQVLRDKRTVALLILGPMIVLTLGAVLFRTDQAKIPVGVVNEDKEMASPLIGTISLGERILDELKANETLEVIEITRPEVDETLEDGTVQAVIVFTEDFTARYLLDKSTSLGLRLEGSNPSRNAAVSNLIAKASMSAMATLASCRSAGAENDAAVPLPISIETSYLFGGEEFDMMDYIAPVYIALLAMFFVFLLACVAFLRERSQGTIERLAASPATRAEIVHGYMFGLGIFALIQVAVILFFTVWALNIHYQGSLALLFLVISLLAVMGVNLGILASSFARTEFQVLQFIPLIILPQALLSGTIWPVTDMPAYLRSIAYAMPLYYANTALRDVMIKGAGLSEIWPILLILVGFILLFLILSIVMMRKEIS